MNRLYTIKVSEYLAISLLLLILTIIFHESGLDALLIKPFFSISSPHWLWRDAFITEKIFHKGGVKLIILITLSLITLRFFSRRVRESQRYKIFIYHTLISATLSIALVALLKKSTPILCPWDLARYGGAKAFVSLSDLFNSTLSAGHCFPGGHSSGAYAWIAIYFSYQLISGRRSYRFLIPGMLLGFIFGVTQQMRGAHFFSHDLATILTCWIISGAVALIMQRFILLQKT